MIKTAIVILNFNGRHHLEEFLPKVIRYSGEDCQVFIADNASTDDSIQYLQQHHPTLPLIAFEKNLGFSQGYNEALKKIKAQYYILLNSDVEVTSGWTAPLVELLDENPQVAACQPKILSYHDRSFFEYAGAAGGFIDFLGYPFCRGRLFETLEKDEGQYNDVVPVFWATGACLTIRSEIFHKLGGFDEDFFAHMEEIDLCWRIHLLGKEVYYCGLSEVFHIGGGTLPKTNPWKTYLNFRNGLSMLYKNTYGSTMYYRLPLRIGMDMIAAVKFLFSNSFRNFTAVFKALADFMGRRSINKQKKLKQKPKFYVEMKEIYKDSIVVDYFLKKKKYFQELKFKNI